MINKALALILIFSLAFNIAFVGIYVHNRVQQHRFGPRPGFRRPATATAPAEGAPWRRFGLKPDQEKRVLEDWRKTGRQIVAIDAEVRELRARLIRLLQADNLDEKALRATRDKIEEDQQKVRELVFDRMLRLRQQLTPEQRRRWVELMLQTAQARGGARAPGPRNARPAMRGGGARGRGPGPHGPAAGAARGSAGGPEKRTEGERQ